MISTILSVLSGLVSLSLAVPVSNPGAGFIVPMADPLPYTLPSPMLKVFDPTLAKLEKRSILAKYQPAAGYLGDVGLSSQKSFGHIPLRPPLASPTVDVPPGVVPSGSVWPLTDDLSSISPVDIDYYVPMSCLRCRAVSNNTARVPYASEHHNKTLQSFLIPYVVASSRHFIKRWLT